MTETTISTDPADHSIDLDGGHLNRTIEPGDTQVSCHVCYSTYATGDWRLLLPDARIRGEQLHMCRLCAEAIGAAVASFPATPAPWVLY